jgi:predicted kinase
MKEIIILSGIPASGKSTWAWKNGWHSQFGATIISRDDIRDKYFSKPYVYTKHNEKVVTDYFNYELERAIRENRNVILDNTFCREIYIDEMLKQVQNENYNVYIKFFDIPLWKAKWRAIKRRLQTGKDVPLDVIENMKSNYDKIRKEKYKNLNYDLRKK